MKKHNERGAGRKKNKWVSVSRTIPLPLLEEVEQLIKKWKTEQSK